MYMKAWHPFETHSKSTCFDTSLFWELKQISSTTCICNLFFYNIIFWNLHNLHNKCLHDRKLFSTPSSTYTYA